MERACYTVFTEECIQVVRSHQDQPAHHKSVVEGVQLFIVRCERVHISFELQIIGFGAAVRLECKLRILKKIRVLVVVNAGLRESPEDHILYQLVFELIPGFGNI